MSDTYSQLYAQFVFAVQGRHNLIKESFRDELEKVICGIVTKHKSKVYAIYCNPGHTHLFVSMHPTVSPSVLMENVKSGSSKWINEKKLVNGKFSWQKGFGAFSYSKSHIDRVVNYVLNQPEHHKKYNFREEYLMLLQKFEIDYKEEYLFQFLD